MSNSGKPEPALLIVDANRAFFVEGHGSSSLPGLLGKHGGAAAIAVAAAPVVRILRLIGSIIVSLLEWAHSSSMRRLLQRDAAANTYLETTYTAEHNRRFAIAPAAPEDFHLSSADLIGSRQGRGFRKNGMR